MEIIYRIGDATQPSGEDLRLIAHVGNDAGVWAAGFVLALSRRWPEPEACYRRWHAGRGTNDFALGAVQIVPVAPGLQVATLIAQHGTGPDAEGTPPIRYPALETALGRLGALAVRLHASVHMPRIASGLAGGRWEAVAPLIHGTLVARGVPVTVYDLVPHGAPTVPRNGG